MGIEKPFYLYVVVIFLLAVVFTLTPDITQSEFVYYTYIITISFFVDVYSIKKHLDTENETVKKITQDFLSINTLSVIASWIVFTIIFTANYVKVPAVSIPDGRFLLNGADKVVNEANAAGILVYLGFMFASIAYYKWKLGRGDKNE